MTTIFDLDGVLSRSDTMAALVFRALRRRPWRAFPIALLASIAALAPADGELRPRCNRAVVHTALRGVDAAGYSDMVGATAAALAAREGNFPSDVAETLRSAARDGECVVSTATEISLAIAYLGEVGWGSLPVFASRFRFDATGPRFASHNVGAQKAASLLDHGGPSTPAELYTDSASDLPLARACGRAVLVSPSRRTLRAVVLAGISFRVLES